MVMMVMVFSLFMMVAAAAAIAQCMGQNAYQITFVFKITVILIVVEVVKYGWSRHIIYAD